MITPMIINDTYAEVRQKLEAHYQAAQAAWRYKTDLHNRWCRLLAQGELTGRNEDERRGNFMAAYPNLHADYEAAQAAEQQAKCALELALNKLEELHTLMELENIDTHRQLLAARTPR